MAEFVCLPSLCGGSHNQSCAKFSLFLADPLLPHSATVGNPQLGEIHINQSTHSPNTMCNYAQCLFVFAAHSCGRSIHEHALTSPHSLGAIAQGLAMRRDRQSRS